MFRYHLYIQSFPPPSEQASKVPPHIAPQQTKQHKQQIISAMPTRTHYVTTTGQPPNGGVPPGVAFHGPPPPPPPTPKAPGPPGPAPPGPAPSAAPPAPTPPFECPGLHLHGAPAFGHKGLAYLFPREHIIIHFFNTGARPFEPWPGPSSHQAPPVPPPGPPFIGLRVPASLLLSELIIQLGAPASSGERYGITQCLESGEGRWATGQTWTVGGAASATTRVGELWQAAKKDGNVVWLAAYDREKHGAP